MVEMQFADFVTEGFNQIVNNLAKSHWRWGQNADVVVRMPTGAGTAAGPFHSQSNEAWFFHTPGLKIVYPSNPYDAKGLFARRLKIQILSYTLNINCCIDRSRNPFRTTITHWRSAKRNWYRMDLSFPLLPMAWEYIGRKKC